MVSSFRSFTVRGMVALLGCSLLAPVALLPAPAGASVVTGLAAYWDFEDDVTSNQVAGAADATVLTGSPTVGVTGGASGLAGNAMVLDGKRSPTSSRDSIQLPFGSGTNAGAGDLGTSFTISAWYWQASDPIDRSFVFETGNAVPANYHVSYGTGTTDNSFTSYIRNTGAGSVTTSYEEWHHVLHSFSEVDGATTLSVYVDGTLRNTTTVTTALDVPAINVGTYRSANSRFFHGMIDEVALWNRALTGYEANAIFRMGQVGSGLSSIHVKADNTDNLNLASSWESGVAPDASNYLVFNATYAQTGALDTGAALPVAGLWITDGTAPIHVNNTNAAHYLEVGALGVDMSTATRDLTVENLRLGAGQTWDIASGRTFTAGATSDLAGDHSITKTGGGTAVLSGANTYTGGTTLAAGTLRVANNAALGTGPLAMTGGTHSAVGTLPRTLPNDVQLGGNVTLGHATNSGTLTLAGEVDLGGATRQITTASDVTIAGVIDNGGLRKAGAGTLSLTGENTYTGGTTISGGTLAALSEDALGSGPVTLAGGALHVDRSIELANDIVLTAAAEQNYIRGVVGVDYLVVGGGGGGAGRDVSGGGGGGGVVSNLAGAGGGAMALGTGVYDVAVGDGGAGGVNTSRGANGEVSSLDSIVALGGGAGGPYNGAAASGASGGGSGRQSTPGTGTDGQGFDGGSGGGTSGSGGGGGGAGEPGGDGGTSGRAGSGGDGLQADIDGSNSYYGGGGGGTWHRNDSVGTRPSGLGGQGGGGDGANPHQLANPGEPNTGGGGGASRSDQPSYYVGGKGGSGIVIVRYPGDPVATGGTVTAGTGSAAGYTLHTFTNVGAHTLEFGPIDLTIAGTISGGGGFTWDTPGTLTLTGANTHSGQTRVTAGTLALNSAQAIQNSTLNLGGGTVAFTAPGPASYTLGGLAGKGTVDAGANSLVVGGNNESTIYIGNLTAAELTKTGSGTLSLSGSNTLGGTRISGGALVAASEGAVGDGAVTLAGGALHVERSLGFANEIVLDAAAEENFIRGAVAADYLVVGGGGGGAGRDWSGGGGGGGVLSNLVTPGLEALGLVAGTYDVTVGDGGAGGNNTLGSNGQASSFEFIEALGGGGGGSYNLNARAGASGGGAGRNDDALAGAGVPGQGFDGGDGTQAGTGTSTGGGGGGGGAGAPGGHATPDNPGDGGDGLQVDIDGSNSYYGGGGGGTLHRNNEALTAGAGGLGGGGAGVSEPHTPANPGTPNTGGGGGASRSDLSADGLRTGGKGGSGVVIVRYLGDQVATGGTVTAGTGSAAGYTLHTFTGVGAHTLELSNAIDATISGTISGGGGFTWDTPGTLTLTGANTHSGQTRVTAGTLALGNTQAVQNSTLNLEGGTVAFTAPGPASYTLGGLAGKGTVDAGANSLVVGGNDESTIYIGNLTAAELTKTGSGTLSLSGSNTLGGTRISGGALVAASEDAVGDGAVTLAGGALHVERSTGFSNQIVLDAAAEENFIRGAVAADYLVVGGGGGGAGRDWGGGGGGGGVMSNLVTPGLEAIGLAAGDSYDVTVGDGGDGGTPGGSGGAGAVVGDNGEQSSFEFVVAAGGGAGGLFDQNAKSGASGGGAGRNNAALAGSGIPGQGFDGGDGTQAGAGSGGGGGGAGAPGGQGTATHAGDGGDGLQVDIDGSNSYYGGGGGGTGHRSQGSTDPEVDPAVFGGAGGLGGGGAGLDLRDVPANPGDPNTGGGGGAARSDDPTLGLGGKGGSGVVIVRYLGDQVATGGTVTTGTGTAAGYTLHTFTDIGAHTLELFNAIDATISSSMTGSGGFTWDTPGTLTLTGTSDYTGATRITAGTLALAGTGSISGSATIDVHAGATFDLTGTTGTYGLQSGQTLKGEGTVRGGLVMNPGSWLSPGASPGILSYDGDLTLNGSGLLVDIWSSDGPGTGHDLLDFLAGTLTLTGDPQITVDLDGFNPALGNSYTIISGFENEVTGGFDPNVLVQNAGDPFSFEFFRIDYGPGSIALTLIPEPGTLVLLVMGLLGLLGFRRRRG